LTKLSIPYGKNMREFSLPNGWAADIIEPKAIPPLQKPREAVEAELKRLRSQYSAAPNRRRAAIAINDKTRPVPHTLLLPALLDWLLEGGYHREDITLIIATGAHAPMTPDEFTMVVSEEMTRQWRIFSHDAFDEQNLVDLGMTSMGTPCRINAAFAEADLKIVVGNIEPHQFMGYSGGVKSAAIGLASAETIRANHAMLSHEGTGPCRYDDNPIRQDVEELGRLIGVDLALNVVLDESKDVVGVFAGDPVSVMKRGIALADEQYVIPVDAPADLVIASPGGFPKDINLYQAQKALRHGARAASHDAPVIIAAACSEGVGDEGYQTWMKDMADFAEVRRRFGIEEFRLGPHKAMLFAADAEHREIYLVSEIPDRQVQDLLLVPEKSIQHALDNFAERWVAAKKNRDGPVRPPRIVVLPFANATIPMLRR